MLNPNQSKLKEKCQKAIKTTMIGSLFIIENEMKDDLLDEDFMKLYKLVREKILDLGNYQIAALEETFRKYEVNSKVNNYTFVNKEKNGN